MLGGYPSGTRIERPGWQLVPDTRSEADLSQIEPLQARHAGRMARSCRLARAHPIRRLQRGLVALEVEPHSPGVRRLPTLLNERRFALMSTWQPPRQTPDVRRRLGNPSRCLPSQTVPG